MGDFFFIVAKGKVSYRVNGEVVGSAKVGDSFGELALLYKCPRAAAVWGESDATSLFRVDQKTFRYMTQTLTQKLQEEKNQLLAGISFLSDLVESDMNRLRDVMTPRIFQAGDVISKKGEMAEAFYVIKDGHLKITNLSLGNAAYEDVTLGPGDYFGERVLVANEPNCANITGLKPGTAFSIDRETFEKVLGNFSSAILQSSDRQKLVSICPRSDWWCPFIRSCQFYSDALLFVLRHNVGGNQSPCGRGFGVD
jgi:cAMP-dependent protein kinase regulator